MFCTFYFRRDRENVYYLGKPALFILWIYQDQQCLSQQLIMRVTLLTYTCTFERKQEIIHKIVKKKTVPTSQLNRIHIQINLRRCSMHLPWDFFWERGFYDIWFRLCSVLHLPGHLIQKPTLRYCDRLHRCTMFENFHCKYSRWRCCSGPEEFLVSFPCLARKSTIIKKINYQSILFYTFTAFKTCQNVSLWWYKDHFRISISWYVEPRSFLTFHRNFAIVNHFIPSYLKKVELNRNEKIKSWQFFLPVLVFHKRIRLSVPTETRKRPSQVNDNPWTYPLCAVVCSTPAWFLPLCWSIEKRTLLAARISHISSRLSMEPEANWYSWDGDHLTERTEEPWLLNSCVLEPLVRSQRWIWLAVVATDRKKYC